MTKTFVQERDELGAWVEKEWKKGLFQVHPSYANPFKKASTEEIIREHNRINREIDSGKRVPRPDID